MFDFKYKKNIQFLRGLSVVFVFLYHTSIPLFEKGYLGVDIFFVISGFVITQKIFQNYEKENRINLLDFYLKRFKRIVPNLFFIISFIYVFYLIFGPPNLSLFNETISALLGISNIYYTIHDLGYFNNIFDDPLLHTWSLGVEEQFYLFYPFLIFLIFTFKRDKFLKLQIIFILIFIISAFLFKTALETDPIIAFYLSPLRFWELIFGGILFLNCHKVKKNNLISFASLFIIIFLIFSPFNYDYFYLNLIIVFLSGFFIIFFYESEFIENSTFVYFGNISYSFYLWHLPVLFFLDLYILNYFYLDIFLSFILTTILSIITYTFIEQKFRYLEFKESKKIIILLTSVFLLILISLTYIKNFNNSIRADLRNFIYKANYLNYKFNWNNRIPLQELIILGEKKVYDHCRDISKKFRKNLDGLKIECLRQKNYKTLFYLEGNSHTAHFVPVFNKSNLIENVYYKHAVDYNISTDEVNNLLNKFAEIIYITSIDEKEKLDKLILNYPKFNNRIKFIFFKSTPYPKDKYLAVKCLIQQINCSIDKENDYKKRSLDTLFSEIESFKTKNNGIFLFDSYEALCPQRKCPVYDKNKNLLYYRDANHLAVEGSETLVTKFDQFIQQLKNDNYIFNY
jgi:peptidoglycan/LPS O-acetylase OafA/YrhL